MRIVIDINQGFDKDNYENLKKLLDIHIDEIMKADIWRGYDAYKSKIKFTLSCFEPKVEEEI